MKEFFIILCSNTKLMAKAVLSISLFLVLGYVLVLKVGYGVAFVYENYGKTMCLAVVSLGVLTTAVLIITSLEYSWERDKRRSLLR